MADAVATHMWDLGARFEAGDCFNYRSYPSTVHDVAASRYQGTPKTRGGILISPVKMTMNWGISQISQIFSIIFVIHPNQNLVA